jgi:hypothetical protein
MCKLAYLKQSIGCERSGDGNIHVTKQTVDSGDNCVDSPATQGAHKHNSHSNFMDGWSPTILHHSSPLPQGTHLRKLIFQKIQVFKTEQDLVKPLFRFMQLDTRPRTVTF